MGQYQMSTSMIIPSSQPIKLLLYGAISLEDGNSFFQFLLNPVKDRAGHIVSVKVQKYSHETKSRVLLTKLELPPAGVLEGHDWRPCIWLFSGKSPRLGMRNQK